MAGLTPVRQNRITAQRMPERNLKQTCIAINEEERNDGNIASKEAVIDRLELKMVRAAWTLRRMPDRESSFLKMRGALWPDTQCEPGAYPSEILSNFEARRRLRISAKEIDEMQPMLDLLLLLPDLTDRQIVFWTAWHQDGERQARIPWVKIRRSLLAGENKGLSRWTLKRRYAAALDWLAALVLLQV